MGASFFKKKYERETTRKKTDNPFCLEKWFYDDRTISNGQKRCCTSERQKYETNDHSLVYDHISTA